MRRSEGRIELPRAAVLSSGDSESRGRTEVAVVGGGVGGLIAGACLARRGCSVTLLEAGAEPGGYLASFRRRGAIFDACVDSVGSVFEADGSPGLLGVALEAAGVLREVSWVELDPVRLQRFPGFRLAIPRGLGALREELARLFPGERAPMGAALEAMTSIHARTRRLLGLPVTVRPATGFKDEPFGTFLERFGLSVEARAALGSYATFLGIEPAGVSTRALADLWMSYVEGGAWRVRGGFGALVDALVGKLGEAGGTLRCGARVVAVKRTARGVVLSGPFGELEARRVVWAAAPPGAAAGASSSFALLYALVRGVPEGCLPSTGLFPGIGGDWIGSGAEPSAGAGGLSYPAPGEERSVGELTPVVLHWPLGKRVRTPSKEALSEALLAVLGRLVPAGAVVWHEAAGPWTLERYTGNPGGAAYGWEQSAEGIRGQAAELSLPPDRFATAGHWAGIGGGVLPAALSGWRAAKRLLTD